jgi:hypothetical protein
MDQKNRCFICRKEFDENNPQSPDRIDCNLPHTVDNIVLSCVHYNKARSNQSLELVQTNESVIRQLQDAIVAGLINVWHKSNVAGETYINYLKYDKEKWIVYSIHTENVVMHITGVDFNALYPSGYSSIYNE